jgi:hypothetical protein
VGQHVTVSLPATTSGSWRAPVVVAASKLSATLRQQLPASHSPARPGVVRAVGRARLGANQSVTEVVEAVKPGDVVLMATLARHCARISSQQARTASPSCPGVSTQWLILLVVVPR